MHVVVCVKQIPDPAIPGELDPSTHALKREGKLILDESDSYGVEMALQLADAAGGGEVTLVSMAPNNEVSGLRTALAMGAAKAILVSDEALVGSDSLSTAKVLAKAIERVGGIDLVLTATESTDGYSGTIPGQVAELLGWPSLTFAKHVEIADGKAKIQRQTEAGYDVVEASLPAVVSASAPWSASSEMSTAPAAPIASAVRRPETSLFGAIETKVTSPPPALSTSWSAISTP